MLPVNVLRYGREESLPEQIPLRAGPLTMLFADGGLRSIRLDGREAIRGIYVAVRDANWGTVPNVISNLQLKREGRSFEITYDVENRQGPIHFSWSALISGNEHGSLIFTMRGRAVSTFLRNRIGFCVLHPVPQCAGLPCKIEHTTGAVEPSVFPECISPHQPFFDLRAISHEVHAGRTLEVRFEGDVFETEDQRNWTDASYKTYCTPLQLPFPAEVAAGTEIAQDIRITVTGEPAAAGGVRAADEPVLFEFGGSARRLPQIGAGAASHGKPLTAVEMQRIAALRLSHLRVDLDLASTNNGQVLEAAAVIGVPLEAALFLSDDAVGELSRLVEVMRASRAPVARWLVFHKHEKSTSVKWIKVAREHLRSYDPSIPIISGTNAYFAELNRGRPEPSLIDGVCFSINPQVHAFDNDSLAETLSAQASCIMTAHQFASGGPVFVSPVTLKPRFNPNATAAEPPTPPGELPPQVDERQMSLFGAGWTLGSVKYLAESGAAGITYYETTGPRGLMEVQDGSPAPGFRSIAGGVFPLYHVLADFGDFRGGSILSSRNSEPLQVDGAALQAGSRLRILLANFKPDERTVRIKGLDADVPVYLRLLDDTNVETAMRDPEGFREQAGSRVEVGAGGLTVRLGPFALARLDITRAGS